MPWIKIKQEEADTWNETLKQTDAVFYQFPYYTTAEYNSVLSSTVFIKYIVNQITVAYAAIIEIGLAPFKVGVIESGPVLLDDEINLQLLLNDLKEFAEDKHYMHLQIRPAYKSDLISTLKNDKAFQDRIFFPFHKKVEFNSNIYNKPEKDLLDGFKMQCRRKIVLAGRLPFKFSKLKSEEELEDVRKLFLEVTDTKGYGFLPFHIYKSIYKKGKKHNLCDIYTVHLNNKLVNAVLIVKGGRSFYHYTSALSFEGYNRNESPPAKLHFYIMQDCFYNEHKEFYNISFGGSDNLIRFKELFNPVELERPPYYTYVIKPKILSLFEKFSFNKASRFRLYLKNLSRIFTRFILPLMMYHAETIS